MLLKDFFSLMKPGIILGNLLATAGGYFLGSKGNLNNKIFLGCMLGMFFVIAAAALSNNIFDLDIDRLMKRTQKRWQVMITMASSKMIRISILFLITGVSILLFTTHYLATIMTLLGFGIYFFIYTCKLKRHSTYATLVGGISGAMPPIAGYCATSGMIDTTVWLLLGSFVSWQIPHAYAVALFYREDFKTVNLPLIPLIKNSHYTKSLMFLWAFLYWIVQAGYYFFQIKGKIFLFINSLVIAIWIIIILSGFLAKDEKKWARMVFLQSLIVIGTFSLMLCVW